MAANNGISRRNFIAHSSAIGMTAAAALTLSGSPQANAEEGTEGGSFVQSVAWDAEYDVVVIGYGFAGGVTAIAAADAGAKVLLLEKAMRGLEGGNSRYAGQGFTTPNGDPEKLRTYFRSLRGYFNTPSDAVIDAYVDKATTGIDWLRHLGVDPETEGSITISAGEYKEFPGGTGDDKANGPCAYLYCSPYQFDAAHYNLVQRNVTDRSDLIDVWYECPATHLVQDPDTKVVHGVEFEHDGTAYKVRAKNGVVMTMGGYENNAQMLQDYVLMAQTVPFGALYNTGDGVTMALEVGARLWHMGNIAGPMWAFLSPECEHGLCALSPAMSNPGFLMVGPSGERFVNEASSTRHGYISCGGHYEQQPAPTPAYGIVDSAYIAQKGRLYPQFSENNEYEIENGYFIAADTIEELAQLIYDDMPDFARLPNYTEAMGPFDERLRNTIDRWNADFEAGQDTLFGRSADTMYSISEPPFYALRLYPTMFNTQGGAERNEKAQVLDLEGNPIPHLYSAGEFGSLFSSNYSGGCNIGECVMYGRIAGEQVSVAPEDVVADTLVSQQEIDFSAAPEEKPELGENEYLGVAWGVGGELDVVCTIADGTLSAVKVTRNFETPGIGSKAIQTLPDAFVAANGVSVDMVSGATSTSRALIQAVTSCLEQAGIEVPTEETTEE